MKPILKSFISRRLILSVFFCKSALLVLFLTYYHISDQNANGQPVVTQFNNQRKYYVNTIPLPAPVPVLPARPAPFPARSTPLSTSLTTPLNTSLTTPLPTNNPVQYPQLHPDESQTSESAARSNDRPDPSKTCLYEEFKCTIVHQCIDKSLNCDGAVDCIDGTDEQNCACTAKIDQKKLCDKYFDCPGGDDELGCDGCDRDSYPCYTDVPNECYTKIQRCDHVSHCTNHEDEKNCVMLKNVRTSTVGPFVGSTHGILYRNHNSNWYPVCEDYDKIFALEACEQELGIPLRVDKIKIRHVPTTYDGKYALKQKMAKTLFTLVDTCLEENVESTNVYVHVQCPDYCGSILESTNRERIASGKVASAESHPWIVGLYLNGTYVCAGSIIHAAWIITAAHCVHHEEIRITTYDYLQARAGFIRQHSFSPYEQTARVLRVVIHPNYNANGYKNDIAMLELNEAFFFNRWVKPICLQTNEAIRNGTDPNWMWKPEVDSTCITAGWGGSTARGPKPVENLRELELPILSDCVEDNANVTCAGYPKGGADTCEGDSGGPLVCTDDMNTHVHYLAGITSVGYDPKTKKTDTIFCGEPGSVTTFTKPSLYVDWINYTIYHDEVLDIHPTLICPGIICQTSNRCVKKYDGNVECLDGEDEVKKP